MLVGYLGDTIVANDEPDPNVNVTRGVHRLNLLDVCNARLLGSATQLRRIMIGTGEHLDLLITRVGGRAPRARSRGPVPGPVPHGK